MTTGKRLFYDAIRHLSWISGNARRITVSIGIGVVTLLLAATMMASIILYNWAIEDWNEDLDNLSLVLAESTAQSMASATLVLSDLTQKIAADASKEQDIRKLFSHPQSRQMMRDKIGNLPQVADALIIDTTGRVVTGTDETSASSTSVTQSDYFQFHRNNPNNDIFFSQPVRNPSDGAWIFYLSRRLNDAGGNFIGIALLGISADFFSDFFKSISLEKHVGITLTSSHNYLLAGWSLTATDIGTKRSYQQISALAEPDTAASTLKKMLFTDSRKSVLSITRKVRNTPLNLHITLSQQGFIDDWLRAMYLLATIAITCLLVLIIAFSIMANILKKREQDALEAHRLKQEADKANQEKTRFLAMMSHEIRTPMNGILGITEMMMDSGLDEQQRDNARHVYNSANELMRIMNEVLDFSKVEAGKIEIEHSLFHPRDILNEVSALHTPALMKKHLRLETSVSADIPEQLIGDAGHIRQVLGNLLQNAIKFTNTGHIMVSLEARSDQNDAQRIHIRYTVSDTGIGIDPQVQARLFEPYTQADNSISRAYGGTGLGLSICKRLVELMQGHIGCKSDSGIGSHFSFEIPCQRCMRVPPLPEDAAPTSTTDPATLQQVSRPIRVLIAEDTPINMQLARMLLEKKGYLVDEAENGQLALDALARQHYDLVLMDCMMPVMDGYEATRRLRTREVEGNLPRTPVIALTASAIEGDRERCLAAGMDDYLSKPFTAASFQATVERWTTRPA